MRLPMASLPQSPWLFQSSTWLTDWKFVITRDFIVKAVGSRFLKMIMSLYKWTPVFWQIQKENNRNQLVGLCITWNLELSVNGLSQKNRCWIFHGEIPSFEMDDDGPPWLPEAPYIRNIPARVNRIWSPQAFCTWGVIFSTLGVKICVSMG